MYTYIIFAAALVAFVLTRNLYIKLQHKRQAQKLGCQPPAKRPGRLPLGIDFIQEIIVDSKANEVPLHFERVAERMFPSTTWTTDMFGGRSLFTIEPANIKALLATQFKDYALGPRRKQCFSPIFAHGIFTDDGERWERSRGLIRPSFAREQLANVEVLERHVQNLMQCLSTSGGWTEQTDLVPLFFRLTLDSSTQSLFGQSVDSQIAALAVSNKSSSLPVQNSEWHAFGPSFDTATEQISRRFRLNQLYWVWDTKALRSSCAEVHRFADHFVRRALLQANNAEKDIENGKQPYIFLHELAKSTQDPTELRDQLLNVLLAGRDTTAGLLGFTWYQLAQHPDIYAKLRATVTTDFGTYSSPRNLDFAGLKACTYLMHVLHETLRLHPAVPINSRQAEHDTTLPHGGGPDGASPVFVPRGTQVAYSVHVMHRRRDLWGADADQFRPERWTDRKAGWEFLPFNGGPRICLGQQSALATAGYVTVRMVQRFERLVDLVQHNPATGREKYWTTVTDAPVHVKVRLQEG